MYGPAKHIYPLVTATIMSFIMSGVVTAINLGLGPDFPAKWMAAWGTAAPLALGAILVAAPVGRWITGLIVSALPRRG